MHLSDRQRRVGLQGVRHARHAAHLAGEYRSIIDIELPSPLRDHDLQAERGGPGAHEADPGDATDYHPIRIDSSGDWVPTLLDEAARVTGRSFHELADACGISTTELIDIAAGRQKRTPIEMARLLEPAGVRLRLRPEPESPR